MARPTIDPSICKRCHIEFRVTENFMDRLKEVAATKDISVNQLARMWLSERLDTEPEESIMTPEALRDKLNQFAQLHNELKPHLEAVVGRSFHCSHINGDSDFVGIEDGALLFYNYGAKEAGRKGSWSIDRMVESYSKLTPEWIEYYLEKAS